MNNHSNVACWIQKSAKKKLMAKLPQLGMQTMPPPLEDAIAALDAVAGGAVSTVVGILCVGSRMDKWRH